MLGVGKSMNKNNKKDMVLALMGVSSLVGERDIKQRYIYIHDNCCQ